MNLTRLVCFCTQRSLFDLLSSNGEQVELQYFTDAQLSRLSAYCHQNVALISGLCTNRCSQFLPICIYSSVLLLKYYSFKLFFFHIFYFNPSYCITSAYHISSYLQRPFLKKTNNQKQNENLFSYVQPFSFQF